MSATILIVEDEFAVARGIQYALQQEGYQVAVAASARRASTSRRTRPRTSSCSTSACPGWTASRSCGRLRASGSKAPVLVLTARDDEVDKVIGLELGADDYLTKPFGLRELMSRIKALLRRAYGDLADAAGGA
jgi:DNA-binding response OmpR family regulator